MNKATVVLLATIGLAWFLLKLLFTVPAPLIIGQLSKSVPQFNAQGVQGTIWNGSAANVTITVDGKNQSLGKTQWQLSKLPLLWGSASLTLSAKTAQQSLSTNAVVSASGNVVLENTDLSVPAVLLRDFAPIPVVIGGNLSVRINHLEFAAQHIKSLDGVLTWQEAEINLTGVPALLGSYVAELSMDEQGDYLAEVSELGGGALGVTGTVKYAPERKHVKLNSEITPTNKLDPGVKNMILQLGRVDAKGAIKFNYEGNI